MSIDMTAGEDIKWSLDAGVDYLRTRPAQSTHSRSTLIFVLDLANIKQGEFPPCSAPRIPRRISVCPSAIQTDERDVASLLDEVDGPA
jgi:hypothetical protein